MADLAADPARCSEMGTAGRERVERLFTLGGMTDRIEALYWDLLKGKRRTS